MDLETWTAWAGVVAGWLLTFVVCWCAVNWLFSRGETARQRRRADYWQEAYYLLAYRLEVTPNANESSEKVDVRSPKLSTSDSE